MAYKQSPFPMISGTKGHSALKKTWKEAYKTRGSRYKDMSEEAYIAEAKRQKEVHAKTGKWDVKPASEYKAKVTTETKKGPTVAQRADIEKALAVSKAKVKTRKEIKAQKVASREAGMSMKDVRAQKLTEKAKIAYEKGTTPPGEKVTRRQTRRMKKAKRLAKRVDVIKTKEKYA